jgi:molecular chaperone DnaJ
MSKRDYYEVLGVSRDADERTMKKAYRKLAMKYHPDRNPGDTDAEAAFKEAAEAYEVLSNPEMRARYDRFGHEGLRGGGGGAGFHSVDDIFSQFGDIFGDFFGFGGRRQRRDGPQRGADLRYDMELTFEEAAFGTSREIEVPRHTTCETCSGSGAKPGTEPKRCGTCGGSGQMHHSQGFFTLTSTCPECRGQGTIIAERCPDCSGAGVIEETRQVSVKIPAGVDDGTRLRLRGEGEAGRRGGPTGDLYVFLHVKASDVFQRRDADLHIEAKVSAIHAALGGTIIVPTLGEPREVEVAPGTQYGDRVVLRNEGIQHVNRSTRGDIVVHFNVVTPTDLGEEQLQRLREFAEEAGLVLEGARHESLPEEPEESVPDAAEQSANPNDESDEQSESVG